jgi:hypothetical protein
VFSGLDIRMPEMLTGFGKQFPVLLDGIEKFFVKCSFDFLCQLLNKKVNFEKPLKTIIRTNDKTKS